MKLILIDIGSYGKEGDSRIVERFAIYQMINNEDTMPPDQSLPGMKIPLPHVIIGDEAFWLSRHVLRSYPKNQATTDVQKQIFNYRLCRARRTTENAFDLLCQTFRIFYSPIAIEPTVVDLIIMATCCLHNLMRAECPTRISEGSLGTNLPRENMINLHHIGGNSSAQN
nr:uncharacterized protein LOC111420898 [Onthophagus taurus]